LKNRRKTGSLFALLAKNYLLFALVLLLLAACVYALWNARVDRLYQGSDWDALTADPALQAGSWKKLERYLLPDGSALAVETADGSVLYASAGAPAALPGADAAACLAEYGREYYGDCISFTENGAIRWRVTRYVYGSGSNLSELSVVLDSDYRVVSGGLGDGMRAYTQEEFLYLAGKKPETQTLYRYGFTASDGRPLTALFYTSAWSDEAFQLQYNRTLWLLLLFVPLALAAVGCFIWWLSRRIRRPLDRLNDAILAQSDGRPAGAAACGGPAEIRRIGESFDRLSRQLAQSETERQRQSEARQKLIADISHDLKTPVTVIAGYADAICDGKVPPEELPHYLRAIRTKSAALTELIDAFHEYSKVEHPDFSLRPVKTDLCEYCREYLAEKYDEIDLAGFSLRVAIPDAPVRVLLDPLAFRRVLDNLLSNSLRYNRLGTVLFFELRAQGSSAVLLIGDNGVGIPADRAATIFEPFVVGDDARSTGGSGLGLAITRRLVEAHGGTITLCPNPPPEYSTQFILKLPLARP